LTSSALCDDWATRAWLHCWDYEPHVGRTRITADLEPLNWDVMSVEEWLSAIWAHDGSFRSWCRAPAQQDRAQEWSSPLACADLGGAPSLSVVWTSRRWVCRCAPSHLEGPMPPTCIQTMQAVCSFASCRCNTGRKALHLFPAVILPNTALANHVCDDVGLATTDPGAAAPSSAWTGVIRQGSLVSSWYCFSTSVGNATLDAQVHSSSGL